MASLSGPSQRTAGFPGQVSQRQEVQVLKFLLCLDLKWTQHRLLPCIGQAVLQTELLTFTPSPNSYIEALIPCTSEGICLEKESLKR